MNEVFRETPFAGELLLENLWWPGSFRMLAPGEIAYVIEKMDLPCASIVMDTGHILSTNQGIGSESEGIEYLVAVIKSLGKDERSRIHGLHLTRSLSADYVNRTRGQGIAPRQAGSFWDRYAAAIDHVRQIDQHDAFSDPGIARLFDYIEPAYVTHEFTYASRGEWVGKIRAQTGALASLPQMRGGSTRSA
jgi:hypothetical protein